MAEETQIKTPSLPADYVSIAVLRERWLERQKLKKQQEEEEKARKEMKCEDGGVDGKKDVVDDCEKGKGKQSDGVEKRGRKMGLYEINGYDYVDDDYDYVDDDYVDDDYVDDVDDDYVDEVKINVGGDGVGGSRGLSDGVVGKFGGGGYGGDRRRFGGRRERIEVGGYRGDRRRFEGRRERIEVGVKGGVGYRWNGRRFGRGLGVGKGNVVEGKGFRGFENTRENMRVSEGEDFGGDYREFGRRLGVGKGNVVEGKGFGNMGISEGEDSGGDYREFGRGLGVGKGKNEGEMRNGVDGKVLEGLKGYGNRRFNEGVEFGNLEIGGGRKGSGKYGGGRERWEFGKGESGDVKRYVVDVRDGNVVDVKLLEDLGGRWVREEVEIGGEFRGLSEVRVDEAVEIGGKFRDFLRNGSRRGSGKYGRDWGKFAEVLGVGKGENVVEKKQNVVDLRVGSEAVKGNVVDVKEENAVDGDTLWVLKGYGDRKIIEAVDIRKKFGDLKIIDGGRRDKFRYGGVRRGFRPRKEKFSVAVRKENEAEKPISVAVRRENEVEKPISVAVRENEVEKPNLADVKGKNDVEKHIPVAVRDKIEVKKQSLVDVTMAESSKGFGHWRGNEAIGGKFGGLSNNGWRKGNGKYGRGRGRFGSWKDKQEESRMMWVKRTDAEA